MSRVDMPEIDKLAQKGFLVDLPRGRKGIPVSIQYRPALHAKSRSQRKEELARCLAKVVKLIQSKGGVVDKESLSVSGQTIDGVIPTDRHSEVIKEIENEDVRLDLLLTRQIV